VGGGGIGEGRGLHSSPWRHHNGISTRGEGEDGREGGHGTPITSAAATYSDRPLARQR